MKEKVDSIKQSAIIWQLPVMDTSVGASGREVLALVGVKTFGKKESSAAALLGRGRQVSRYCRLRGYYVYSKKEY